MMSTQKFHFDKLIIVKYKKRRKKTEEIDQSTKLYSKEESEEMCVHWAESTKWTDGTFQFNLSIGQIKNFFNETGYIGILSYVLHQKNMFQQLLIVWPIGVPFLKAGYYKIIEFRRKFTGF